jgi:hypothetical protein
MWIDDQEFVGDTSLSWRVQVPDGSTVAKDERGRPVLFWDFNGRQIASTASEVLSLGRLALHGFRLVGEATGHA